MHAHEVHACEMHVREVHAHETHAYEVEMHARNDLGSPDLQTVVRWSSCRDLSCKIRAFALRDKRSLLAAALILFRAHPPKFGIRQQACQVITGLKFGIDPLSSHTGSLPLLVSDQ